MAWVGAFCWFHEKLGRRGNLFSGLKDTFVTEAMGQAYCARQALIEGKLAEDGFSRTEASCLTVLCISALQESLIQAGEDRSSEPIEAIAEELGQLIALARLSRRS